MNQNPLSERSERNLVGVHTELVRVVRLAHERSEIEFIVTEGLRSAERQAALVKAGASWTLRSRHLTGHAIDVAAMLGGEVSWDWPLYYKIAEAMRAAAAELKVPIVWGGSWSGKKKDGPHYELDRAVYP